VAGSLRCSLVVEQGTFERHYSVEELAELWNMSPDFVRRLFANEPGVVVFHRQRPGRRAYRTLRIPETVAVRVRERLIRH
jgi:transcriptional regulator GlxA family with amidase domain